ncbi:hypothetical protein MHBO_003891 [Bonamia ostreae]|uniref:BESS domain-containing protein n=1 Tax=Bonamia ostreae TaxID=126728 RepID=A0ABV2ARS7_9EUKA
MSRPETPEEAALETFVSSRGTSKKDSKREGKRSQDEVDQTICNYFKKASVPAKAAEKPDDVDLFLQPMVGTIRKLPARQRAEVKFKIHEVVHKAEMSCMYPPAITQPPFPQTCSSYPFGPTLDMPRQQNAMYEAVVGKPTHSASLATSSDVDSVHYSQL